MNDKALTTIPTPNSHEMQQLLVRAQAGDVTCLPALKSLLDKDSSLWKEVGDLSQHAELSMLRLAAGSNLFLMEAMKRRLAEMKEQIGGPCPTPLEKVLVERIAITWLQVHFLDLEVSRGMSLTNSAQAVYAQRKLDSANRRYLHAIRQLATVRKLLHPESASATASKKASSPKAKKTPQLTRKQSENALLPVS